MSDDRPGGDSHELDDGRNSAGARRPDYDMADSLQLRTPEQFKALGDPLRQKILGLLSERAATTSQLAAAFGSPTGTMGHHLQVLLRAELIQVVRTRQVRAMTEKYYGRVARSFVSYSDADRVRMLEQAIREYVSIGEMPIDDILPLYMLRHARIPESRAREFAERLVAMGTEFTAMGRPGEKVYGLLGAVYPTDWPDLPADADEQEG